MIDPAAEPIPVSHLRAPPPRIDARRARWSLLVFFAVLVPISGFLESLIVRRSRGASAKLLVVFLLMWTPALASLVARVALREGFNDISLRLGGASGRRAILRAAAFPLAVCVIAYGIAWSTGLAAFEPPQEDSVFLWPRWVVPLSGSPALRFAELLVAHLTLGTISELPWSAGEEIGWRGYLVQRLIDARVPLAIPLSGLVWAMWHWPLSLGDRQGDGHAARTVLLFTLVVVPIGCAMARQRLETGSLWPAIVLHSVWNDVMAMVFSASTPVEGIWLGETGILVVLTSVVLLLPFLRGRWAARRSPGAPPYAEVGVLQFIASRAPP